MLTRVIAPLFAILIAAPALKGCSPVPSNISPGSSSSEAMQSAGAGSGKSDSSLELMRRGDFTSSSGPLKEVYYEFDQHTLRVESREILKGNANWLKANPGVRVEIEGHADERGTNEYNLALGSKRAESCKDYLVSLGIPEERLSTVSYGEEAPACRDHADACWQKNRRARFVIVRMGRAS